MSLSRFAQLARDIERTSRTSEKVAHVERYFRECQPRDGAWALLVLTGQRLTRVVGSGVMMRAASEASGLPLWLLEECREAVGDTSETIALVLPAPRVPREVPLHAAIEGMLLPLRGAGTERQALGLREVWGSIGADDRLVLHKLMSGTFRMGVQARLVVRALASIAGVSVGVMAHRVSGLLEPTPACLARVLSPDASEDDARRPYPFCLAHQLDAAPPTLGDARDWIAEWKWDGVRAQLIRRDVARALWSRGEEPLDAQFPGVLALADALPDGTVLDGELLAWEESAAAGSPLEGGRPLGFAVLQTMLGRKVANAQGSLFEAARSVVFMAFDVLEHEGRDVRAMAYASRRVLLETLVAPLRERGQPIRVSPVLEFASWDQAAQLRAAARERGHAEGLMLKRRDGVYHVGRLRGGRGDADRAHAPEEPADAQGDGDSSQVEAGGESEGVDAPRVGGGWWKWKLDPYTVDAVLIAAQPGSGRRAGLFTDLTFGVWDERRRRLVSFAKAYSGLTDDELQRVDGIVRRTTVERKGPVRLVSPTEVFEIAFQQLQASGRHASGVAVRFPRILRWRHDKSPAQADSVLALRALLRAGDDRS